MKKRLTKFMASVLATAVIMTSLPVNSLTVQAVEEKEEVRIEETVSGADSGLAEEKVDIYMSEEEDWTSYDGNSNYEGRTQTLTVTGSVITTKYSSFEAMIPEIVRENVKNVIFQDCIGSDGLDYLLKGMKNVETIEFNNFDTSNVTDMSGMFSGCSSLKHLDLSGFDTSNVMNMEKMFYGCRSLASLNLTGFDTSNVTSMRCMFENCESLVNVDLNSFDISNVSDMVWMFHNCSSLTSVDLSNMDASSVMDMKWMFENCSSLTSVDLSNMDTSKVTTMHKPFVIIRLPQSTKQRSVFA